ncbi:MAG TPA: hypothetical protein VFG72_12370 [Marmoricola sp.]|nr:hypothetical protein [Marmoricola sp.]
MTEALFVSAVLLVALVIVPATLGLVFDVVRANRPRVEVLLSADHARARATLAYYNEVHDSHSG